MSRGARALTMYGCVWVELLQQFPHLSGIDEKAERDHKTFRGTDVAKAKVAMLMKQLDYKPSEDSFPEGRRRTFNYDGSTTYLSIVNALTDRGLQNFVAWVKKSDCGMSILRELPEPSILHGERGQRLWNPYADEPPLLPPPPLTDADIDTLALLNSSKPASAQWGTW